MKDSLILQDKIYISAKRVHELFGYTSDYVGQLCRAGKLDSKIIGRSWFVTEKSIVDYKSNVNLQDKIYLSTKQVHELFGYTSDYVGQLCRAGKLDSKIVGRSWYVTEKSIIDHKSNVGDSLKEKAKRVIKPTTSKVSDPILTPILTPIVSPVVVESNLLLEVPKIKSTPSHVSSVSSISPASPISFVPQTFAAPEYLSKSFLSTRSYLGYQFNYSSNLKKLSLGLGVLVIAIIFLFQSSILNPIFSNQIPKNTSVASVSSASKELVSELFSLFSSLPKLAMSIFTNTPDASESLVALKPPEPPPPTFNGLAVVPSTKSLVKDEELKRKIRESFSDEVQVKPDKSGTAGVITPVFRKAKGDDFVYVLVPVSNEKKN